MNKMLRKWSTPESITVNMLENYNVLMGPYTTVNTVLNRKDVFYK